MFAIPNSAWSVVPVAISTTSLRRNPLLPYTSSSSPTIHKNYRQHGANQHSLHHELPNSCCCSCSYVPYISSFQIHYIAFVPRFFANGMPRWLLQLFRPLKVSNNVVLIRLVWWLVWYRQQSRSTGIWFRAKVGRGHMRTPRWRRLTMSSEMDNTNYVVLGTATI